MKQDLNNILLERFGAEKIIDLLKTHIAERRQLRIEQVLNNRLVSVQLAIEMPGGLHNAFAAMRSCEIFGVFKIHFIAPHWEAATMRNISKGAMDWVDVAYYENINDFLSVIQSENICLAGAIPGASATLELLPIEQPICLLFGSEQYGLSPIAEAACDYHYQIPMFGMTKSLNVAVAAAISLYETTNRKRHNLQKNGDLSTENRRHLLANYYLNSVNPKLIAALIKNS